MRRSENARPEENCCNTRHISTSWISDILNALFIHLLSLWRFTPVIHMHRCTHLANYTASLIDCSNAQQMLITSPLGIISIISIYLLSLYRFAITISLCCRYIALLSLHHFAILLCYHHIVWGQSQVHSFKQLISGSRDSRLRSFPTCCCCSCLDGMASDLTQLRSIPRAIDCCHLVRSEARCYLNQT